MCANAHGSHLLGYAKRKVNLKPARHSVVALVCSARLSVSLETELMPVSCSTNQKLVLPRYAFFSIPGSLQKYSLRAGAAELHVSLPRASAAGEALTAHHLVSCVS